MAKQRYVNTKFWRDRYINNLDPSEKLLFLYFLTNPDTNISGIYEIPIKIISADTGFDKEMIMKIIQRFTKDEKIKYINGWVAIKNFTLHQQINMKIKSGIIAELKNAPEIMIKWVNLNDKIGYTYPIHSLSDLNINSNTNNNTNINPNIKHSPDGDGSLIDFYTSMLNLNNIVYKPHDYEYAQFHKTRKKYDNFTNDDIKELIRKWFDEKHGKWCGYALKNFWSDIGKLQISKQTKIQDIMRQLNDTE